MNRCALLLLLASASIFAAEPDIVVNNSTGSNTGASGAPSGFGPFSAAATCDTNGVATTVIDWVGNPLTGVPTDGSAALWLQTASGRRWSKITARAADTVTVADSFNIPAGTPVDCAVGGKRSTLDHGAGTRVVTQDLKLGWFLNIEATGADYSMATALEVTSFGSPFLPVAYIRGTLGRPRLVWTANVNGFGSGVQMSGFTFENLELANTSGVKTLAEAMRIGNNITIRNVIFDGWNATFESDAQDVLVYDSEIRNGVNGLSGNSTNALMLASFIHDQTSTGTTTGRLICLYCIFSDNGTSGIGSIGVPGTLQSTIFSNTVDGMLEDTSNSYSAASLILASNGDHGAQSAAGPEGPELTLGRLVNNNAYFGNVTAPRNNFPVGPNDQTAIDPAFVSPGTQDWAIGPGLNDLGWPPSNVPAGISSLTFTSTEPGVSLRPGGGARNFAY